MINKVETFEYLVSIVQENRVIVGDVVNWVRCSWTGWREATGVLYDEKSSVKGEKEVLQDCREASNGAWIQVQGD